VPVHLFNTANRKLAGWLGHCDVVSALRVYKLAHYQLDQCLCDDFPSEIVSESEPDGAPSYATRSATGQYRTAPPRGLWQHVPYFHNGTAETLEDVAQTYNSKKALGLTEAESWTLHST
jgi:hypothetical protein